MKLSIDAILDYYNDLIILHKMFGDEVYRRRADRIINKLRGVSL